MRGPKAEPVVLSQGERIELERLERRHTTAQHIARRARIILRAAAGESNSAIARQVELDVDTVRAWRSHWNRTQAREELSVAQRLADQPRPGRDPTFTAEQVCRIVALTCEAPEISGRPITQWTGREIADEAVRRGIVERISPRHASRLVKRGISSHTGSAAG
ncbi:MAG TPA: helix-turn-helix domain-containing protein [Myxococcaceae bacterium]|nr:helix-turn-helix domain-containing protein [Myxococcaceae bacterium]